MGCLTKLDAWALEVYVEAYSEWRTAVELLNRAAAADPVILVTAANGDRMENPLMGVIRRAGDLMVKTGSEMGLSPAARSGLHVNLTSPQPSKFQGLIDGLPTPRELRVVPPEDPA
jgi:P27 family predicted phage terminase small subunit